MSEIQVGQINSTDGSTAITTGADGYVSFAKTQIGGRRNLIINGAMQVAQRGTSNTSFTFGYALDRMYLDQFSATGGTHTYQQLSSDPPVGFRNYLRWQRNSGETATGAMRIYYTGETSASDGIAGNKLTLSFYARAGADYSGGNLESRIVTGEGTDQSRSGWANGLWTNQVNDSQSNTLTTSWQRFTHTLASACGNDVSQHALRFVWTPTGTASTNDYIEITGVQLEVGTVATPFEHRSYGEELALCQRYYTRLDGGNLGIAFVGYANISSQLQMVWQLPTPMRTGATEVDYTDTETVSGTLDNWEVRMGGNQSVASISYISSQAGSLYFKADMTGTPFTIGNAGVLRSKASNTFIAVDVEL